MKLTITLKLVPNTEQFDLLKKTVEVFNQACNYATAVAWDTGKVRQFDLHREIYATLRDEFDLSAQLCIWAISKVTDCYERDRKWKHTFHPPGATVYDSRVLSYKEDYVSIWVMGGRLKIPFVCANPEALYLGHIRGEADLILRDGAFYLYQTVDIETPEEKGADDYLGIDIGIVNIATGRDITRSVSGSRAKERNLPNVS